MDIICFPTLRSELQAWQDPFAAYSEGGYQIAQSLFAIGSGGWFGTGLFRGQPDTIPVAETDLIFSAMTEEMGLIFITVSDPCMRQLLCDVFEYCDGIA